MHVKDCDPSGFAWLNGDAEQSTLGYVRYGEEGDAPVIIMCNFTPVLREEFRVGVPLAGHWEEVLNTDSEIYDGGNRGNLGGVRSTDISHDGQHQSVQIVLPPLSVVVLRHVQSD